MRSGNEQATFTGPQPLGNELQFGGGKGLVAAVSESAKVPVIKHLDGVCHVYIDADADLEKAVAVAVNAKTQRYGTCNTMETLLVARGVAPAVRLAVATARGARLPALYSMREMRASALRTPHCVPYSSR